MSLSKKLDPTKLTLGPKKEIIKENGQNITPNLIESAIQQIHVLPISKNEVLETPEIQPAEQELTKRTTLDIPISLHKQIKRHLIDKGLTIKDYFLELARADLKI